MRERARERQGGYGFTRNKYFCSQGNMVIANANIPRLSWKVDLRRKWVYSQVKQTR